MEHIVVVGASAAGLTAAETFRRQGFSGTVTVLGDELHPPYDRPPLSKKVLAGEWEPERTTLRTESDFQRLRLDLELGRRATGLNAAARTISLAGGDRLRYDGLIIATGLRPRRLPFGHDLPGVHVLRTLDDALTLRAQLLARPRVVVIGAGFLGCEVAATARGLGLDVSLVGVEGAPLARQVGTWAGGLVADMHRDHGVSLHMGRGVVGFLGRDRVAAVILDDGTRLPADAVVVAIGSVPAVDWLAGSGIPVGDGVLCDGACRAVPGVYVAGDVANWPHPVTRGRGRLETRTNATEQASTAAKNLLAGPTDAAAYSPIPFGWTDQYDAKIQTYGWCPVGAEVKVVDGDPREHKFVALYYIDGRVVGAIGWNSPRALRQYRTRVAE
ncbi:NAD(P)/FAD-dependent oxidoreductase [Kutzneria sp. NPDC052558]|uniref:NAD(P)/FAD-dependent oxidoreductase n=1 Tax=Kutzneria sp. NPDC052558 TaxID=3364121 RepID=UPI0037CA7FF5